MMSRDPATGQVGARRTGSPRVRSVLGWMRWNAGLWVFFTWIATIATAGADAEIGRLHDVRPEACKQCHEAIYHQWKGSMHANSTALKDPIHAAFYEQEVGDPRAEGMKHKRSGTYPICLKCHAPVAAMDRSTKLDAKESYANGVGCVTCHSFKAYKGTEGPAGKLQLGIDAYEIDDQRLWGPSGVSYTTERMRKDAEWPLPIHHPQPMQGNRAALFKSNEICMGCHERRNNPQGIPLCQTGGEYASEASFVTCQSCHMPRVDAFNADGETVTVFDHSMAGGQDPKMVQHAVALDMNVVRNGDAFDVQIALHNRLPHSFPTGAPFRNAYLKLGGYDAEGRRLWRNFQTHPMNDDPQAMFVYVLGKDGEPAMPPVATEALDDSRLRPNERRLLGYSIPASPDLAIIRAELLYNLLSPPLIERFGDRFPDELKRPKLAASAEYRP